MLHRRLDRANGFTDGLKPLSTVLCLAVQKRASGKVTQQRSNTMNVVHLHVDSAIARITIDHPVDNRINFEMREELLEAIEQVAASDARVLVIKAAGENFSLGGDVRDWSGVSVAVLRPQIEVFARALDHLHELEILTIASVQRGCMGRAVELARGGDLMIARR